MFESIVQELEATKKELETTKSELETTKSKLKSAEGSSHFWYHEYRVFKTTLKQRDAEKSQLEADKATDTARIQGLENELADAKASVEKNKGAQEKLDLLSSQRSSMSTILGKGSVSTENESTAQATEEEAADEPAVSTSANLIGFELVLSDWEE